LITSASLNLVEQVNKPIEPMLEPLVSSYILVKLVLIQPIKRAIPPNTFQQHLLETFFLLEVGEMEINKKHAQITV
jgi:hypothetical protein